MPRVLVRGPDGQLRYVNEDEEAKKPATRKERVSQGQPRKQPVDRQARAERASSLAGSLFGNILQSGGNPIMGLANAAVDYFRGDDDPAKPAAQVKADLGARALSGGTFGLDKRLRAATGAALDRGGYGANREAEERAEVRRRGRTGFAGDVAEFGGAMAVPIGGGVRAIKAANAARLARGGKELGKVTQGVLGGTVTGGLSGLAEGAARSPDFTEVNRTIGDALTSGAYGAGVGAVLGPAAGFAGSAIRKGTETLSRSGRRRLAREALEDAEQRIIQNMDEAGLNVGRADERIAEMVAAGSEPRIADIAGINRSRLRALTDKGTRGTDQAAAVLDERSVQRGGRLRNIIANISGIGADTLSAAEARTSRAARKAQGSIDYAPGGPIDQPMNLTPQQVALLQKRVAPTSKADAQFQKLYADAVETVNANPNNPRIDPDGPATGRAIDEMLRGYRQKITALYKAGKGNRAAALRAQFDALRDTLREQNPEYAAMVDDQARGLAEERAFAEGDKLAKSIFNDPRAVMDGISQIPHPEDKAAIRTALVSRLFSQSGNPANLSEKILRQLRDPNQPEARKMWDFVFGGPEKTDEALKWLRAEHEGALTERRLLGTQTSANMAGLDRLDADSVDIASGIGRALGGTATLNPAMATSGGLQAAKAMGARIAQPGIDALNQAELKTLMRRVERGDLTRMQQRALKTKERRIKRRSKSVTAGGRAAGYLTGKVTQRSPDDEEY